MIETKPELGVFNFESKIPDGEGIRVLKRFLKELTYEISKNAAKQIANSNFPPSFAYREKQLHTIIAPSMDRVADNFLMESPVNRSWSLSNENMSDAHGWVDYWCEYCDYSYYIELKHGFMAYKSKVVTKSVKENWGVAYNQLDALTEEINVEKEYSKGVFKILVHILPIYLTSGQSPIDDEISLEQLIGHQHNAMEQISTTYPVNWSALWMLNNNLYKEYAFLNCFEKYPALLFMVNVSEISK